jgi:hypothetical protein
MLMKSNVTLAIALLWPLACLAAESYRPLDVRPGLWETSITSQLSGMPPIPADVLARLTPEQRARIEAAMKAREAKGPQTTVHKSCLTSDDLKKPLDFGGESNGMCKRTIVASSATRQDIHIECTSGAAKTAGDVHVEAVDPENVKGDSRVTTADGSRKMDIRVTFTGRWLGASCGDLKGR